MTELPSGADYDARFETLAEQGRYLHGEADLVMTLEPTRVLDAGCGTGRVAIELHRRGIPVVGVDADESMLAEARRKQPALGWHQLDLAGDPIPGGPYDLVLMAGNVLLFTRPGTESAVVANVASVLTPAGRLVAGFSLQPGGYDLTAYDAACIDAGLGLVSRWSTWAGAPCRPGIDDYAVSLHARR